MHFAIGIGTALLGGWLLNAPPSVQQQEEQTEEAVAQESTPSAPGPVISPSRLQQGAGMAPGRATAPAEAASATRRESATEDQPRRRSAAPKQGPLQQGQLQQGQSSQQTGRTGMMTPLNPTETAEDGQGAMNLPAPPTAAGAPGMGMPQAPTYRRPARSQLSPETAGFQSGGYGLQQSIDRGSAAPPREKAFAQSRPITSGVSPWQNLFRNDNAGGTIDNYTTLVRPSFEQQNRNQQFSNDIYGLERSSRIQNSQLQQLSRGAPRSLQSIATPQYYMRSGSGLPQSYMNYGNYYQGGLGGQSGQGY